MTVSIKFLLYLESSSDFSMGKKVVSAELKEGSTFGILLQELENNFGSALAEEIYDSGKQSMKELVIASINGVLAHNLEGSDTMLNEGDTVIFLPLAVGG